MFARKVMSKLRILMMGCVLTLVLTAAAGAQMGGMMGHGPQPRGLFNPIVGSGAQYEIQSNGKDNKMVMEIDVVGKESIDGKDGYWFESTVSNPQMGEMVMKMLTVPDGANTTVTKMVMQMAGPPPMEMPMQMGHMGQQQQPADIRSEAEDLGTGSVTTPAGTFMAHHYRMK